jgi:hypothetical protein
MGRWNHRDRRYRLFFSLVCFDWIGAVDHENVREQVLAAIDQHAEPELALSWVFVIEHNEKPSHNQFLGGTAQFLQERNRYPRVRRERACIVFANTAGRSTCGRVKDYGQSSLIFPPDAPFRCYLKAVTRLIAVLPSVVGAPMVSTDASTCFSARAERAYIRSVSMSATR